MMKYLRSFSLLRFQLFWLKYWSFFRVLFSQSLSSEPLRCHHLFCHKARSPFGSLTDDSQALKSIYQLLKLSFSELFHEVGTWFPSAEGFCLCKFSKRHREMIEFEGQVLVITVNRFFTLPNELMFDFSLI